MTQASKSVNSVLTPLEVLTRPTHAVKVRAPVRNAAGMQQDGDEATQQQQQQHAGAAATGGVAAQQAAGAGAAGALDSGAAGAGASAPAQVIRKADYPNHWFSNEYIVTIIKQYC